MVRAVVASAVLAASGCHLVFGSEPPALSDDATVEVDAGVAPCTATYLEDRFDDNDPCAGWGTPDGEQGCQISETADGLLFQPANTIGSRCRCRSIADVPLTEGGIVVEVTDVLGGDDLDFTVLSLMPVDLTIGTASGKLQFTSNDGVTKYGSQVYAPSVMRWWRLRRSGPAVIAEYSQDAVRWNMLGEPVDHDAQAATVSLSAGLNMNNATADGRAVYKRFAVCN